MLIQIDELPDYMNIVKRLYKQRLYPKSSIQHLFKTIHPLIQTLYRLSSTCTYTILCLVT